MEYWNVRIFSAGFPSVTFKRQCSGPLLQHTRRAWGIAPHDNPVVIFATLVLYCIQLCGIHPYPVNTRLQLDESCRIVRTTYHVKSSAAEIDPGLGYMVPSGEIVFRVASRKMYGHRDIPIGACPYSNESGTGCKQFPDSLPGPETGSS